MEIKIIVAYHKKAELIKSIDFLPIHVGRSLTQDRFCIEDVIGDDTGENISNKNNLYNEMTAVYYVWKNVDASFYGLTHYRRQFLFDENAKKTYYSIKKVNDNFFKKIKYSHEKLNSLLEQNDFIAPKPMKRKSVYEHYKNAHDVADLDYAIEVINDKFPEFSEATQEYVFGQNCYFYNMFIFDKETFNRYCEFVFGVLSLLEERFAGKRMFISERLTGIFITQLIKEGKNGLFLPVVYLSEKDSLKNAIKGVKEELALRKKSKKKSLKSLIYAFRPLLIKILPNFLINAYRNKK